MSCKETKLGGGIVHIILSAGILFMTACGVHPRTPVESQEQSIARITQQAGEFDKAFVRKDVLAIETNLTNDFRLIRSSGEVANKESFLNGFNSPSLTTDPYTVEDFSLRLYGDAALVGGKVKMTGTSGGVPYTLHYRYVHTYVRVEGKWKICNIQITPIS